MTIIVCKISECMYNSADRCQCDAIGMDEDGCDSYGQKIADLTWPPSAGALIESSETISSTGPV